MSALSAPALAPLPASAQQSAPAAKPWDEQPWKLVRVRPRDRACLMQIGDRDLQAINTRNLTGLPLAQEVFAPENVAESGQWAPATGGR